MTNEAISQFPLATAVSGPNDLLLISQYTGAPGTGYTSKKIPVQQVANTFLNNVATGIEVAITNSGSVLSFGVNCYASVPFAATITQATLLGAPSGTVSVDIWRCSYTQFDGGVTHPVAADSICGGNLLSLSSGTKVQSTLAGWNTVINSGDVLAFYVESGVTSTTNATVILYLNRALI